MNSSEKCKGAITRTRIANGILEESIIDFVIISIDLLPLVNSMLIDKERKYVLTRFTKENDDTVVKESDHNMIFTEFHIAWKENKTNERIEFFNYKNIEAQ